MGFTVLRCLLVLVLCVLVLPACGSDASHNVLLITLDTVRADRFGCYGYEAADTPAIDRLAKNGVLFEQAFTAVPITLPSHTTILTGVYPPEHGVRDNGLKTLNQDLTTMAEVFKDHGYNTAAFVGASVLDAAFGLDRGFDAYDDDMASGGGVPGDPQRPANEVVDGALRWLDEKGDDLFFCWVHFYDAHTPYSPPAPYSTRFAQSPYDGEIAFVDSQVARLVDWLNSSGMGGRTLVVIAGDHGEGLGDHGEPDHCMFVYDTTMRVPMVFSLPGVIPGATRITASVGVIDIFPTLVDYLGFGEVFPSSGRSLTGALTTGEIDSGAQYGESQYPFNSYGWCPQRCLITDEWKYIRAPTPELYDRINDTVELVNLAPGKKALAEEFDRKLAAIEGAMIESTATGEALTAEELRRLTALGYSAGGSRSTAGIDLSSLKDPKEMVGYLEKTQEALGLLKESKVAEAETIIRKLIAENPGDFVLLNRLGTAFRKMGDEPKAIDYLRLALKAHAEGGLGNKISVAAAYSNLGALIVKTDMNEAIRLFRTACTLDPINEGARENLGRVLQRQGYLALCGEDWGEGLKLLREAHGAIPGHKEIRSHLARGLAACPVDALRDSDEALRLAEALCAETDRQNPEFLDTLAIAYASAGRFDDAIEACNDAVTAARKANRKIPAGIQERCRLFQSRQPYRRFP